MEHKNKELIEKWLNDTSIEFEYCKDLSSNEWYSVNIYGVIFRPNFEYRIKEQVNAPDY